MNIRIGIDICSELISHEQSLDEGIKVAGRTLVNKSLVYHFSIKNLLYNISELAYLM